MITLQRIFIYPLKSAAATELTECEVLRSGPVRDRRFMLVDDEGQLVSQRNVPKLALLRPFYRGDNLIVPPEAEGEPPLVVRPPRPDEGQWIAVQLWKDQLRLQAPSAVYDSWLSERLGVRCRLAYLPHDVIRPVEEPFEEEPVTLADGYPLLVLGQGSVDLLNEKLEEKVSFNRFRPNLLVGDTRPHEEDEWRRIRIGEVEVALVKPCVRCSTVLVDQETAERGVEPLRTLAEYRRQDGGVTFAQNGLVVRSGWLRSGDPVEVLE